MELKLFFHWVITGYLYHVITPHNGFKKDNIITKRNNNNIKKCTQDGTIKWDEKLLLYGEKCQFTHFSRLHSCPTINIINNGTKLRFSTCLWSKYWLVSKIFHGLESSRTDVFRKNIWLYTEEYLHIFFPLSQTPMPHNYANRTMRWLCMKPCLVFCFLNSCIAHSSLWRLHWGLQYGWGSFSLSILMMSEALTSVGKVGYTVRNQLCRSEN